MLTTRLPSHPQTVAQLTCCTWWTVADNVLLEECEDLMDAKVKIEGHEAVLEVDPSAIMPAEESEQQPSEEGPQSKRRRGARRKSYCCDVCGLSFNAARDLRIHLRSHDDNLLPSYECWECKRSFLWPSHLERHMRTHTGVRPYTCYACDRQFAQVFTYIVLFAIHTLKFYLHCVPEKTSTFYFLNNSLKN